MKQLSRGGSGRRSIAVAAICLLALLVAGLLWWQRTVAPEPAQEPLPTSEIEAEPAGTSGEPSRADAEDTTGESPLAAPDLPLPDEGPPADPKEVFGALSSDPLWNGVIAADGLIDLAVAAIDALADGLSPRWAAPTLRPAEPFVAAGEGDDLTVHPDTYARYDRVTALIVSLDPARCVAAYRRLLPQLQASYLDLGRDEPEFGSRVRKALSGLLATPKLGAAPRLIERPFRYDFADPRLQTSTDAQKQMLRLGPSNLEQVRAWLGAVSDALDAAAP